jgi:hypothetical protein
MRIDLDKLERPLEVKQIQKQEAMRIEETQRLVIEEIEMLKVVFCLMICMHRLWNEAKWS